MFANDYIIKFSKMPWQELAPSTKQKQFQTENELIRLLRLEDGFEEIGWCTKGHIGVVMKGEITISINGTEYFYQKGDVLFIPPGPEHRHKAMIASNAFVELFLVEKLTQQT